LSDKEYPVKSYENYPQKVLEGFDIYTSAGRWIAIVVVETEKRKELRLYAWRKRGEEWKVDLASLNIGFWDLKTLLDKAEILKQKYNISK
jgi:phage terminase large subunit GpA-like protein